MAGALQRACIPIHGIVGDRRISVSVENDLELVAGFLMLARAIVVQAGQQVAQGQHHCFGRDRYPRDQRVHGPPLSWETTF